MKNYKVFTAFLFGSLLFHSEIRGQSSFVSYISEGGGSGMEQRNYQNEKARYRSVNDVIKSDQKVTRLDKNINTDEHEMGPLVSPDGKTFYFSRYPTSAQLGLSGDEDIWYSKWDEQEKQWSMAENIGAPLNNDYPNFISSISGDGKTIYLGNCYLKGGKMANGVSMSRYKDTSWTFPENILMEKGMKSAKWGGCYISSSGKFLIMSCMQDKKNFGAYDLYIYKKGADNKWSDPVNLGSVINSKGAESAPFLSSDEMTIFFTSDGMGGAGGTDIFMSVRLDDSWTNWSKPENLGTLINTEKNESFFFLSEGDHKIYFCSDKEGNNDILSLETPQAENTASSTPIVNHEEKPTEKSNETIPEIPSVGPVRFASNSSVISEAEAENMKKTLNLIDLSLLKMIEVNGYADETGSVALNDALSVRRANAVAQFLAKNKEFAKVKILTKGFGSRNAVGDNKTEEGKALNRRAEIKLVKK
ncbi:MAG TPA: OmpA family protein [Bacteroidia bacterium]|nr:OmpA family protein [Bacteroidia bacterium]